MPISNDETIRAFFSQLSAPAAAENAAIIRNLDIKRYGINSVFANAGQQPWPGQTTIPRVLANGSTPTLTTARLQLTRFTATRTELVSAIAVTGRTAAVGATVIRYGVYTIDNTTGDFTLVASTPNDTALLAAVNTRYSKALSAAYVLIGGQDYALGVIVSAATTLPIVAGQTYVAADLQSLPVPSLHVAAADLPATQTLAGCTASTMLVYAELT